MSESERSAYEAWANGFVWGFGFALVVVTPLFLIWSGP